MTILMSARALEQMPRMTRPTVSVIVPTLNEAKNIPQLFAALPNIVDEIVLVDGNSKDNTVEVARRLRPDVKVVMQKGKGKGNALKAGFEAAQGDIIVMLDADGSTDPAEIHSYVGTLIAGADFAKGSRFMQGGGTSDMEFHRYLGNQFFVWAVRLLFGSQYTDLCYGYNAFWARTLPLLKIDGGGFEIETMMNISALQAGLIVAEVPSFESRRFTGFSNLRAFPDGWRVLKTIFREWRNRPVRSAYKLEGSVKLETFRETFRSLLEDMLGLFRMREQLPLSHYQNARQSLITRYNDLMNSQMDCQECAKLQARYQQFYADMVTSYLPENPQA